MDAKRLNTLSQLIKEWIDHSNGWFTSRELDNEINIKSPEGKSNRRAILKRLADDGIIERHPNIQGTYRKVDSDLVEMDWFNADETAVVPLVLPFDLQNYVRIFPKSLIVVAGAPNAGKTAFLYNVIMLNLSNYIIELFNSETSKEQMKDRFLKFDYDFSKVPPFKTYERYDNFSDIINPDNLSIIDYLDFNSDVYMVGDELEKIFRKLNKGVAVIALQKKPGADLAVGGMFSLKKPALYVTMDSNTLTLVKGKSWVDPQVNPNGMKWGYKLVQGCKFIDIHKVY